MGQQPFGMDLKDKREFSRFGLVHVRKREHQDLEYWKDDGIREE